MQPRHAEVAVRLRAHLRNIVDQRCVSLAELSERTGYSATHISNVLSGRRGMRPEMADAMAHATGTTFAQLFTAQELSSIERWTREQCDRQE